MLSSSIHFTYSYGMHSLDGIHLHLILLFLYFSLKTAVMAHCSSNLSASFPAVAPKAVLFLAWFPNSVFCAVRRH
jgi:hypothetical protein